MPQDPKDPKPLPATEDTLLRVEAELVEIKAVLLRLIEAVDANASCANDSTEAIRLLSQRITGKT